MKILKNCTIVKLREYSQSYGQPETIKVSFIKEFEKEIHLISSTGIHQRTMKKGTKVLISFDGKEIKESTFIASTKKALNLLNENRKLIEQQRQIENDKRQELENLQIVKLCNFLSSNPEKINKIRETWTNRNLNNSQRCNKLRMLAAKWINNGSFEGLQLSAFHLVAHI